MRPNETFRVLKDLLFQTRGPLRRKGLALSKRDTLTTLEVYQQWLLLMVDLGYLPPCSLRRDSTRIWSDLVQNDVLDVNGAMSECLQLIRLQSVRGFKALCKKISSHLYSLIEVDADKVFLLSDVVAGGRLVQLFSYTSRLTLNDIDLKAELLTKYRDTEDKILSEFPDYLVVHLNRILKRWTRSFDVSAIRPRHGPGGVAGFGRCSLETKYNNLATDELIRYAFGQPYWIMKDDVALQRTSKTIFVPKSYKTFRTISMEPTTLQYFQQGVWAAIREMTCRVPYLRNHFGFDDSERNQRLAREGSIFRNFATIDLSSASDSVSYGLVKRIFKGTPLLRFIVATRSRETILPDGSTLQLKKFATMGSALCFPVMTLLFAALCDHVTRVCGIPGRYSVYGDDIIVPTECTEMIFRMLAELGFSVNTEKSYSDKSCWFRESCGGEYLDGFDVTPMRVSRKYSSLDHDVRYSQLVSLCNTAFDRSFLNLRHFFVEKIREEGSVPYFSPRELVGFNYTNYHAEKRWNRNYQRYECRVSCLRQRIDRKAIRSQSEDVRLRHWLESNFDRKTVEEAFVSVVCEVATEVSLRWRELPDSSLIDELEALLP